MATRAPGSDAAPPSPLGPEAGSSRGIMTESQPSRTEQQSYPIIFIGHKGKRFVFPFESCKTYEAFKSLLEQIYARSSEDVRNKIREEKYDLLTSNYEVILPSVWESVVRNHLMLQENHGSNSYTINISFWPTTPLEAHSSALEPDATQEICTSQDRKNVDPFEEVAEEVAPPRPVIEDEVRPSRSRSRSPLRRVRMQSRSRSRSIPRVRSRSRSRASEFVRRRNGSHSSAGSYYLNESDDDSETAISDEDAESVPPPHTLPPPRTVNRPQDRDGNRLSYLVDTKWPELHHGPIQDFDESGETEKSKVYREMKSESPLRILKALQVSSENRMSIQIHTLSSPENPLLASSVGVRWYHLSSNEHLDFAQFKAACLGVHGLTSRTKRLITKTLEKVEKEKLHAFLDGMFIEPGTVLRGDEISQKDPESVIFSCVPFLEAQAPVKLSSGKVDRYHPPRSLMQSYYPYEPVRERDMEQAFKKFKTGASNRIIHVPSIWVLNIDRYAVVTCGYHSLTSDFVKSITVVPEDSKMLNPTSPASTANGKVTTGSNFPNIRLTDWEGRVLLYTLDECRTYFEIEQRLRELRYFARGPSPDKLELVWDSIEGLKTVTPLNWLRITKRRADLIFIDLCILDNEKKDKLAVEEPVVGNDVDATRMSVPPFFQWVHAEKENEKPESSTSPTAAQQYGFIPPETKHAMHCLEVVEKAMLSAVVPDYEAETIVDRSFTSVAYYQSLPEETLGHVRDVFVNLLQSTANRGSGMPDRNMHQIIVDEQCTKLCGNAAILVDIVHETLKLFVSDVDKSTMLRKLWGALSRVAQTVNQAQIRSCIPDPEEFTNKQWTSPLTGNRRWFVRNPRASVQNGKFTKLPEDETLKESLKSCRDCRQNHAYSAPAEALEHLRNHLQDASHNRTFDGTGRPPVVQEPNLQDWIRNDAQLLVEETNAGFLVILTQAIDDSGQLFIETQELAEGVKNPEGKISDLYTFPHELLKTIRKLITYYLVVERSIYYTEEAFQSKAPIKKRTELPYDKTGIGVMRRFYENTRTSLLVARKDLCNMARSKDMHDIGKRLSLSPEYICSWFIVSRKLLVKPIDNSMTVGDLYREYLSTLQFQVNHRPGKRLLRSINLLQEELAALEQVNSWQANFVQNYLTILDDSTYQVDKVYRRALFPYERVLLSSCLDTLNDAREDFGEMILRCGPLSESTKQSAEINEEDHGKAILVFTVVTIIFLPLSFVTSYLGMNTSDIRDMDQKQSLFWEIALPLTALTMGSILFIAYNGDELRERVSSVYRRLAGKQDTSAKARGISVAQRKRASKLPSDSSSTVDYRSLADEAEYAPPRP
ncbi:hypothetical protein K491DRAFT_735215, partial [Lophiostoma macrostomum CBS 122681]